jgi:hypothetical protein
MKRRQCIRRRWWRQWVEEDDADSRGQAGWLIQSEAWKLETCGGMPWQDVRWCVEAVEPAGGASVQRKSWQCGKSMIGHACSGKRPWML